MPDKILLKNGKIALSSDNKILLIPNGSTAADCACCGTALPDPCTCQGLQPAICIEKFSSFQTTNDNDPTYVFTGNFIFEQDTTPFCQWGAGFVTRVDTNPPNTPWHQYSIQIEVIYNKTAGVLNHTHSFPSANANINIPAGQWGVFIFCTHDINGGSDTTYDDGYATDNIGVNASCEITGDVEFDFPPTATNSTYDPAVWDKAPVIRFNAGCSEGSPTRYLQNCEDINDTWVVQDIDALTYTDSMATNGRIAAGSYLSDFTGSLLTIRANGHPAMANGAEVGYLITTSNPGGNLNGGFPPSQGVNFTDIAHEDCGGTFIQCGQSSPVILISGMLGGFGLTATGTAWDCLKTTDVPFTRGLNGSNECAAFAIGVTSDSSGGNSFTARVLYNPGADRDYRSSLSQTGDLTCPDLYSVVPTGQVGVGVDLIRNDGNKAQYFALTTGTCTSNVLHLAGVTLNKMCDTSNAQDFPATITIADGDPCP